ncbi:hypothetical protein BM1_03280 [Bipolaris maydis]|nr:hypothetical protein BM1_03280 [Bipolaris maydis]
MDSSLAQLPTAEAMPAQRSSVDLEVRVKNLQGFIERLATADEATRISLLSNASLSQSHSSASPPRQFTPPPPPTPNPAPIIQSLRQSRHQQDSVTATSPFNQLELPNSTSDSGNLVLARAREGCMRKLTARKSTQFYGGTSLFPMHVSEAPPPLPRAVDQSPGSGAPVMSPNTSNTVPDLQFPFSAKDETCRKLMATFFQSCYFFHMYIYREWFLRDYDAGDGPYYSDPLMFAICAIGSLISLDPSHRRLSSIFTKKAESLVWQSLELPDITILQTLMALGQLEIGQGRSSKGWLYCGMAFRLTHEMGLHIDPNNWTASKSESSVDREILRRVYWAVFAADKQLSMYFGRPPALYPYEADVRDTIRIPYPPEWEDLLRRYICKNTSPLKFEDGIPRVASLIHQIELAKISHTMIVEVFQNRRRQAADETEAAAAAHQVHLLLVKWLSELPQMLHWNQWTVGRVPSYVLHLHMLFHTSMIILYRPPRQHLDEAMINSEDVEICYQSLSALLRLLKSYGSYYRFDILPLDFVQTLATAAEVVMMRRYIDKASWNDKEIAGPIAQILEAMEAIQRVFPCIQEIKNSILRSIQAGKDSESQQMLETNGLELDIMDMLHPGAAPLNGDAWGSMDAQSATSADLGFLVTDDFLNQHYARNGTAHWI